MWWFALVLLIRGSQGDAQHKSAAKNSIHRRLSDYPVLKRWEIPIKANVVGRRNKDLWGDSKKKRSFWEAKPQFTLHELEMENDPEKIYMDLHYSRNMLEDDSDADKSIAQSKKDTLESPPLVKTSVKKAEVFKKDGKKLLQQKVTKHKEADKKRLIALKPFLSAKHVTTLTKKKKKKRSRRSLDDEELEDSNIRDDGDFSMADFQDGLIDEREDAERVKRDSESIANFYFDQYDDDGVDGNEAETYSKNNGNDVDDDTPSQDRQKRSIVNKPKDHKLAVDNLKRSRTENIAKLFHKSVAKTHSAIDASAKRSSLSSSVVTTKAVSKTDGNSAEQRKAKALIQKAFFSSKHGHLVPKTSVRHIIPESSTTIKKIVPNVDVKVISKNLLEQDIGAVPGLKKDENSVSRQHIAHPEKSTDSINTANVARAVAVAMEQLKRDKMWGKVFVHVRPSGELKVMVQETKKMEEET